MTSDKKPNSEGLFDSVQELSRSQGLHYFERGKRSGLNQDRYITKAERHIVAQGKYSWKADLCERIDKAREISTSSKQFIEELAALGVSVYEKNDDWVYCLNENPDRWKVRGWRLGRNYAKLYVEPYFRQKSRKASEDTGNLSE